MRARARARNILRERATIARVRDHEDGRAVALAHLAHVVAQAAGPAEVVELPPAAVAEREEEARVSFAPPVKSALVFESREAAADGVEAIGGEGDELYDLD